MSDALAIRLGHSAAFLPPDGSVRRLPRHPERPRPADFAARFEAHALVYDCFWHRDGQRILLVGPPPLNLKPEFARARCFAEPSGQRLRVSYHASTSVMLTELSGAPVGTTEIRLEFAGQTFNLPVLANLADSFAGRRVAFTMSRDNDLAWIVEWARWHAHHHGTDAVILFDNGSTRYASEEIEATLLSIPGLATVAVESWPWQYGMTDPAVTINPFYGLFLQVASMSVVLRRFAGTAYGILNCDIDELVVAPGGRSVFKLAKASKHGLVVMSGRYIEAAGAGDMAEITHRAFTHYAADPATARSRPRKWAIDPTRNWFADLDVHPYMHWIEHRPLFSKTTPEGLFFRHFRGINTNWKELRTTARVGADALIEDTDLVADFGKYAAS